jgi:4-diphosphocytidyl-2C-methyl-D-erythritol kinase
MSQPKAIDLLGYALENNYSIDKALNVLDVGDQIILQDKEAYSNYVENPENPNSLNAKEFDIAYAKAKALKNVYDKGHER